MNIEPQRPPIKTVLGVLIVGAMAILGGCQTGTSIPSNSSSGTDSSGNPFVERDGTVAVATIKTTIWNEDGSVSTESNDDVSVIRFGGGVGADGEGGEGFYFTGPGTQRAATLDWPNGLLYLLAGDDAGIEGLTFESVPVFDDDGNHLGDKITVNIDSATLASSTATTARMPAIDAARQAFDAMTAAQQQVVLETWLEAIRQNGESERSFINAVESVVPGAIDAIIGL